MPASPRAPRLALPLDDLRAALEATVVRGRGSTWLAAGVALLISWWIYVPIHELAHAFGCLWAGGEVSRLEIAPRYGASLLQRLFPWVVVGSDYAGRLAGFNTRGNDLIYLVTVAAPFLLTILVGVPLLRAVPAWRHRPLAPAIMLGLALPVALAPIVSLTGDYYEMGSILVSRIIAFGRPSFVLARWRSDDLLALVRERFGAGGGGGMEDALGILASFLVGVALAWLTYALGAAWSGVVVRRARSTEP